jgi:excinuclease UvrABC helicase subunit UvrB
MWRKAAKACGMPIQIEIWESLKPCRMNAVISVYDPDLDNIWQKYQKTLIKRYNHYIEISDLMDHKVEDIQKRFQQLFDKTAKGKKIISQKRKEDEIKAHKEMMAWTSKPSTNAMFAKAIKKSMPKPLLSRLLNCPPSNKISVVLPPQAMKG